ncbi:hypothetical protein [Bacteroides sp. ET336]|uniref:hypothetical protein n=1 Tax=Bacteroides sp. ET336 TaxID=2972459 RepID=UPI0021AC8507|nr:hypothetical protein [Bacteroides sp. ET336]MCR8893083.1 hypothetical protein [Bacteroides sp. ET336]MDN0057580.1 hypothetical protein [Bacteroides caecigallinarum]
MKKKTKRNLIITAILIVLISAIIAWLAYPFVRYSSHTLAYRSTLPENACYQYPIQYSEEGWFLIDCVINGKYKVPLRIDTQATSLMREDSIHAYSGEYWGNLPIKSTNAYQKKDSPELYTFTSISFGDACIQEPMFNSISKDNIIYNVIDEGIFGTEMLAIGTWKFDTETGMMTLFHSNNKDLLAKETIGMIYYPQGLREDSIPIYIEGINDKVCFTLDMGYAGVLEINNALADRLKTHFHYKEEITKHGEELTDTLSIFKIPVTIAGTRIDSCEIVNSRIVNTNYIGAEFMHHCNFVLHHSLNEHGKPNKDLYLKVRE